MPRQRPLVLDSSNWNIPLRVPPSSAAFSFSMEGCLNVPLHHLHQSFLIDSLFRAFHTSDMESILCDCAFVSFHVMFLPLSLFFFHFMSPSLNPVSQVCATAEHLAIETAAHVLHTSMTLQLQVTSMFVYMRHTNM